MLRTVIVQQTRRGRLSRSFAFPLPSASVGAAALQVRLEPLDGGAGRGGEHERCDERREDRHVRMETSSGSTEVLTRGRGLWFDSPRLGGVERGVGRARQLLGGVAVDPVTAATVAALMSTVSRTSGA